MRQTTWVSLTAPPSASHPSWTLGVPVYLCKSMQQNVYFTALLQFPRVYNL